MQRLLLFFAFLLLLGSCSPETRRLRQWNKYLKDLKQQPVVPPDTSTGRYAPGVELDVLDQLLRKYPGRALTRTITRTETKEIPGKTVYVEVPVQADTARNRIERDSLLQALQLLVQSEKADSELRAEVARLRAKVLQAFNARACLPDTLVKFPAYGITFKIERGATGKYGFSIVEAPQKVEYPSHVTENVHERLVYLDSKFWQFWQFWLAVVVAGRGLLWKAILLLKSLVFP
ncbi:hypothetical protein [Hymenobacter metallilatus]|uniref:Uncharacterized protein n=1 Tax=Hymenobacter metallilatus TaxID=2493666 RepID=A0A3R9MTU3_9BACT|nr:hypothetical protein [Hymenobacter metallilatus]RSK29838.1 hypothetical protein EI290_16005 [Hymenobacter metallilatus]